MMPIAAEPIHIVYFGTPAYAIPALEALANDDRVAIELVVTQPDRPAGRGRKLTPPPVKQRADALGLEIYQPERLRTAADREPIARRNADLFVTAAFGMVFGPRLLALPLLGSVNLHASILPDYRGASPISAAILEGALRTGVTLMQMDTGLDTGPILAQRSIDVLPDDTTASLTPRLAQLGAELLRDSLDDLLTGKLSVEHQRDEEATLTRPLVKADGWIDWRRPAREIERQVRAMWDWPRAWTTLDGAPVQIHRVLRLREGSAGLPGSVSLVSDGAVVATGDGQLLIEIAQAAGGKPISGKLVLERAVIEKKQLGTDGVPALPNVPLIRSVVER